jgi:hypothetical protein
MDVDRKNEGHADVSEVKREDDDDKMTVDAAPQPSELSTKEKTDTSKRESEGEGMKYRTYPLFIIGQTFSTLFGRCKGTSHDQIT